MNGYLAVAAGGALGAAMRHGVGQVVVRHMPDHWPYGTFAVNIVGSFLMGFLISWLAFRGQGGPQELRLFLATGLLGGFTTFSAFSLEVANFVRAGDMTRAAAYAALSVVLGLMALFFGLWLARKAFA
ncbi:MULTISPECIES: fluoride efflux transporter CrcB [Hyphomonas]|uniref:Fluoride-specific ion channel FluC n=1 Tax=Hyphomonas adhaerens TaxID=81029 RepID=A0A3B9GWD0_9PROT|nr:MULTISPECIES: fluoride efflux transporter CrcB [Hyphomonas]MBB41638.1 fluoride efflux transporter CrcB [Hyphomonas sp.]HAE26743.1 fluoride efflux transporter CrcB [Hyphomonas adhaerens]|tara:strand:+ start:1248 stop:1631 length:384 start_codon:yes stop_codon:yes gene_type:complete